MGTRCSCCGDSREEEQKRVGDELCEGPVSSRGCTDVFCLPIFGFAQLIFVVVTIAGVADGDPTKLYKPRDFQGAYCGTEDNWGSGPNTMSQPMMSYTMNVTSTVDVMMKQLVCSSVAQKALVEGNGAFPPLLHTEELRQNYLCDCCISPCKKCTGSLEVGGDLSSGGQLSSTIGARMGELTNTGASSSLFDPSGANRGMFSASDFWNEATLYFNKVCLPTCDVNFETINTSTASLRRKYTYEPMKDDPLHSAWSLLLIADENDVTRDLKRSIDSAFTFEALPISVCPYAPAYCVPFPGMKFSEVAAGTNYCQFKMAAEVVEAIGSKAAATFEGMGGVAFANAASQSFGDWVGDFQQTLGAFVVVSLLSFVIGIIFLVLLRFFIGVCVWLAVFMTVFFFIFGGALCFVRSGQCANADLFSTGQQTAVAVAVAGSSAVSNAVSGAEAVSEDMTGDGQDYRGVQRRTKTGKSCARWDEQTVMPWYNSTSYGSLKDDYCRNPYRDGDYHKASSIWCVTSDPEVLWEECLPIGVIMPECEYGYAVQSENARKALYYTAFVVWGMGLLWKLLILCFINRIRLAIALNKVAAHFLSTNPLILLVPMVQAFTGIIWCLLWMLSASFLLSQVPDSYTPTQGFATYQEAYGTSSTCAFWEFGDECGATAGKCNDQWPTGAVWKDVDCGPDSAAPACWKCYPPRYIFDTRFAISFFVFLWNNAFNIALGQIIIAMAVSIWFFSREKGKVRVVGRAVKTIFRYHTGSVAFGSFIVAVVQFIRYVMKYLEKQSAAQKNRVMVLILKVVQCCLWCFEKCIRFLNKNAYIQIALHGTNFCVSAKKAFFLILRNALRFATVAALAGAVHVIGFVCIMVSTVLVGYLVVKAMHDDISPVIPCVSYLFVSFVVAKLFMNVFGLAVDTSLQCFIACEEMGGRDFDVPPSLKKWVQTNVKDKDESK